MPSIDLVMPRTVCDLLGVSVEIVRTGVLEHLECGFFAFSVADLR